MNTVYRLEGEQGHRKDLILLCSFYGEEQPSHIRFERALRPPLIGFSSFTAEEGNEVDDHRSLLQSHISNLPTVPSVSASQQIRHVSTRSRRCGLEKIVFFVL